MANTILLLASLLLSLSATAQQGQNKELQFSSPIIPIVLKSPVAPPTAAQAKDHLLWYKGKKIDDSTLITPQATLVRWSKPREIVIVQLKKDPTNKIVKQLAAINKQKKDVIDKVIGQKNSFFLYPYVAAAFQEFDRQNEQYSQIIKNTVELPTALEGTAMYKSKARSGGSASYSTFNWILSIPEYIKRAYQEVMTSMKNYPPIDFPAPPAIELGSCSWECDSNARKKTNENESNWLLAFTEYEAGINLKSFSIMRKIHELRLENDPEAVAIFTGLDKAKEFAFARATNKVDLLIRKYGKDFTRLPSVIRAALSIERQKQLLGIGADDGGNYARLMTQLISLFDGFDKYIEQQMDARNYDLVFNAAYIISMERQKQLFGDKEESNFIGDYFEKINAFNRFKITYSYDVEWAMERTYGSVLRLESEPFYMTLVPAGCAFKLIKNEANPLIISEDMLIKMKVITATAPDHKYIGAMMLKTHYPTGAISFCKQKGKLIFHNSYSDQENWKGIENAGDIGYIISEAVDKAFDSEEDEHKSDADENESDYEKATSFKEMKVTDHNSMKLGYENAMIVTRAYDDNMYTHPAVVKVENKAVNVIDEKVDGKKNNPQNYDDDLKTAWLTIKLEHDPQPYKTAPKK